MKYCEQCQEPRSDTAAFCPECGVETSTAVGTDTSAPMMTIGGMQTIDPSTIDSSGAADELQPGTEFASRYTIEECVGRGGMGVVYKAVDRVSNQIVALKLIRPGRAFSPDDLQRLINEGVIARDIRDPNVVAVYDVAQHEGQPFVTMELIEGESLRSKIRHWTKSRHSVPASAAVRIIRSVLSGLKAAHSKGVIHRDLKPENIMISGTDADPQVKVLDFGIAQAVDDDTASQQAIGTRGYMAPEQVTQADLVGPEADIYSVSVMFYELLVGVLPQGHWQPPSSGRSDVHPQLDALIERGLSNNRAKRPQSADEYLGLLPPVGPPPVRRTTQSPVTRQRVQQKERSTIEQLFTNPIVWLLGAGLTVLFGGCLVAAAMIDTELEDPPGDDQIEAVVMPDLIGWDAAEAKSELEGLGIRCFINGPNDGSIRLQPVWPGKTISAGDSVTLTSSY